MLPIKKKKKDHGEFPTSSAKPTPGGNTAVHPSNPAHVTSPGEVSSQSVAYTHYYFHFGS